MKINWRIFSYYLCAPRGRVNALPNQYLSTLGFNNRSSDSNNLRRRVFAVNFKLDEQPSRCKCTLVRYLTTLTSISHFRQRRSPGLNLCPPSMTRDGFNLIGNKWINNITSIIHPSNEAEAGLSKLCIRSISPLSSCALSLYDLPAVWYLIPLPISHHNPWPQP